MMNRKWALLGLGALGLAIAGPANAETGGTSSSGGASVNGGAGVSGNTRVGGSNTGIGVGADLNSDTGANVGSNGVNLDLNARGDTDADVQSRARSGTSVQSGGQGGALTNNSLGLSPNVTGGAQTNSRLGLRSDVDAQGRTTGVINNDVNDRDPEFDSSDERVSTHQLLTKPQR